MDNRTRATLKKYARKTTAAAMAGMAAMTYSTPALAEETAQQKAEPDYEYAQAHDALEATTLQEAKEVRDAADKNRQEKESTFADATDALTDAQTAHELIMDSYTEQVAKTNKATDAASAAIAKALDEAILESKETASNAEYAQLAYDRALTDKNAADAKLTAAKSAADRARQDYDAANEAMSNSSTATSELDAAKAAYNTAQKEAINAKKAADDASAALSTAKSATVDAADKVSAAEQSLSSATTRLKTAQSSYDTAKANYDASTEEGLAQAETEFIAAREALTAARSEETSAKNMLASAQAEYDAAKASLDDWQAKYDDAVALRDSYDLSFYDKRIEEEQAKLDELKEEQNKAIDRMSELNITLGKAEDTLNAANKEVDDAQTAVDNAKKALDTASAALDLALAQSAESQQKVLSLYDFLASEGYEIDDSAFTMEYDDAIVDMSSATHAGEKGDATDFRNVLKALASLREVNSLRLINGQRELLVSNASMIQSSVYANWVATAPDAKNNIPYNDNVALGTNAPLNEWYYAEKSIYDSAVESGYYNGNPMPENWQNKGLSRLKQTMPDFYAAVRNYLNVINSDWAYAGAGLNSSDASMPVYLHSYERASSSDAYSVDDWQARFMNWIRSSSTMGDAASNANIEYIDAFSTWAEAQNTLFNVKLDRDRIMADVDGSQREYLDLNQQVATLGNDIKSAEQRVANERSYKSQVEEELANIQKQIDEADAQIPVAQVRLDAAVPLKNAAETAANSASSKFSEAQTTYNAALSKYTSEQIENSRLKGIHDAAKESLTNAQTNYSIMSTALESAKTEHEEAQADEQAKQTAHEDASSKHTTAAALAASAKTRFEEAQKASNEAQTNIEEANRLFGLLEEANNQVTTASQEMSRATEVLNRALTSLQVVNAAKAQLEAEEANIRELSQSPVRVPLGIVGYEDMDNAIQTQLEEEATLSSTLKALSAAENKVKEAQRLYDETYEQWRDAVAEAALAQARYDELLAMTPDTPDTPDIPDTPDTPNNGDENENGSGNTNPVIPDAPGIPDGPAQANPADHPGQPSDTPSEDAGNTGSNASGSADDNNGNGGAFVDNTVAPSSPAPATTSTIRVPLSYIIDSIQAGNTAGYYIPGVTDDAGAGVDNAVDEASADENGSIANTVDGAADERDIADDLNPLGQSNDAATAGTVDTDAAKAATTAAIAGAAMVGAAVFVGRSNRRTKRS